MLFTHIPALSGDVLLGFSAGTGGANCTQDIDNFAVRKIDCNAPPGGIQKPMDIDRSGEVDITGAINLLQRLFLGGDPHVLGETCQPIIDCPDNLANCK